MQILARSRFRSASTIAVFAIAAAFLAACSSSQPKGMVNPKKRSKEYFSEAQYGVKASPRVAHGAKIRRGGGRDQIGKPYKVRGRMYYPKEDKNYSRLGLASWYGAAFHGRLTANGEIYDMTQLTAAHPTMPLPSYARVTNTENGASIVVRVNDRGPYSHNRLIDLSSRAADLLDYKRRGTATVKVDYLGRAPLEGSDDHYLMASYRPGNADPDPSDGLATGVMIAMNGPTPSAAVGQAAAFPGSLTDSTIAPAFTGELPAHGPVVPDRPDFDLPANSPFAIASMSYADEQEVTAFAALEKEGMTVQRSWKRMSPAATAAEPYIAAGSFTDEGEADRLAAQLAAFGRTDVERSEIEGTVWYGVNLHGDGRNGIDELLLAAWENGAPDAMTVRD
ncbi:MAG: rare lipoprotein [Rhizobiaceae bacterium]|jgi:rare lipoprotein A|nr:rare lipoprotein [Rhizobiaceae bacterium]